MIIKYEVRNAKVDFRKISLCVRELRFKLGLYGLGKTHKLRNLAQLGHGSAFQNLKALKQR